MDLAKGAGGDNRPLIHERTAKDLEDALNARHHGIALLGPYGAGKGYLAGWLAEKMLGAARGPASIRIITPGGDSIGIDQVRAVASFLKLKAPGRRAIRRVVIIEDAHAMTLEAQNALLKTLEEPPPDTRLILTVAGKKILLPTLYSRLLSIDVSPVARAGFLEFTKALGLDRANAERAFAISGGLVGLGLALAQDREHELLAAINSAKQLLASPVYERLLMVDALAKDKQQLKLLLFSLKRVLSASVANASVDNLARLVQALKAVHAAEAALPRNPNSKLLLTNVMLRL